MIYLLRSLAAVIGLLGFNTAVHAQDAKNYPARPVRLVVPYAPGGTADTIARIVSDGLYTRLGRPVVLDTRSGANSVVGCEIVANSTPDGHTLIVVAAGFAVNPSLRKKLPYDSIRDFAPVG
ncbi:MAG: tripartite tricarboxylate transporter substrate binding protein, partial [Betaproteobacteria bacterium]|nr:tripartite tricarboxylate transporter substrate binding protein [Betaproteobacteria bacterium]